MKEGVTPVTLWPELVEQEELKSGGGKERGEKKTWLGLQTFYIRRTKIWIIDL